MPSVISSPVAGIGSSATVSTTVVTSSLTEHGTNQQLSTDGCGEERYLSETFLRFFAGVLPDAATTSAILLLDFTLNAASNVLCTAGRGGMVVSGVDVRM